MRRTVRPLFLSLGGVLLIWSLVTPQFRNSQGFPSGTIALPVSLAASLFILAIGLPSKAWKSTLWLALAVIGSAAGLQMIFAGPDLHYQHYRKLPDLVSQSPWLLIILAVQTVFVGAGFIQRWGAIKAWLLKNFKIWQLAIILLFMALASTALSRDLTDYLAELIFAAYFQILMLVNVVYVAWDLPEEYLRWLAEKYQLLFGRSRSQADKLTRGARLFPVIASLWVFLFTATTSFFIYERHPHVPDEVIYIYQARYFADGLLKTPAYPVPEAFSLYLIPYLDAQWYSPFPPGWPALLAIGTLANIPWLINPLLAALCIWLSYLLVCELYNLQIAQAVTGLLMISPWFLFMGMNFMSHTFMLAMTLTACLGVIKARQTDRVIWGLCAGAAVGVLSLIRPVDGLVVGVLLGLWALGAGGKRLRLGAIAAYGAGILVIGALILPYNLAVAGDPLKFPLNAYYEKYYGPNVYALGFGSDRGFNWAIDPYPGYTPLEAVINSALNTHSLQTELFGWGAGSLLFVLIFLVSGRFKQNDYLLFVMTITVISLYALFWYSGGPDFGARYWYVAILPIVLLSVRGMETLMDKIQSDRSGLAVQKYRIPVVVIVLCFLTLINYLPWRVLDKYYRFQKMSPEIQQLADRKNIEDGLVFIEGDSHPDFASAWIFNPLFPNDRAPIYVHDIDIELRSKVIDAYPDRKIWFVAGPTITGNDYQIVDGPLTSNEARQWSGKY